MSYILIIQVIAGLFCVQLSVGSIMLSLMLLGRPRVVVEVLLLLSEVTGCCRVYVWNVSLLLNVCVFLHYGTAIRKLGLS